MVPVAGFFESRYVPAFRTFAEVLFCVVALQTIAPTLNYMGFLGDLSPIEQQLVVAGAKLAAAVALVAILRFSKAPLLSVQVFKVVTPCYCSPCPLRRRPTCSDCWQRVLACISL